MKTNKSFTKRLKLSPSGKVLARKGSQNHFRAKASRVKQLALKQLKSFQIDQKKVSRFIPGESIK